MKKIIYITLILLMGSKVNAQQINSSGNLKWTTADNELFMEWSDKTGDENTQWVIQASENGKEYNAIGYVWGADPKEKGSYKFKQKLDKISQNVQYVRVWKMLNENLVLAAEAKTFSK